MRRENRGAQDGIDECQFHCLFSARRFDVRIGRPNECPGSKHQEKEQFHGDHDPGVGLDPGQDGISAVCQGFPEYEGAQAENKQEGEKQSAVIVLDNAQGGQDPENISPEQETERTRQAESPISQGREEPPCQRKGDPAEEGDEQVPGKEVDHEDPFRPTPAPGEAGERSLTMRK